MKLLDIINLKITNILPSQCKLHLAGWNGTENPIDEFLAGTFEQWQSLQNHKNFKRKYIISLIQLPENNKWLLGGIFQSKSCQFDDSENCYRYETKELSEFGELTGRVVLLFKRKVRQPYLNAENWLSDVQVSEIMPTKMVVQEFPGYRNVLIPKNKLDIIVSQNISTWESALSNVAGVYLITDTANGKVYVGSATGEKGIWQRWCEYSKNGHGGNKNLANLVDKNNEYSNNFQYSILEIADTHASKEDILNRESFWKDTLCSRIFGYNEN